MSRYSYFFLLGILTLGALSSPSSGQTYTTFDGHSFTVNIKPDKGTIMLGETTFLSFEVKNLSDTELSFGDGGDYRNNIGRPDSYRVTVVRDDGKPVPQPKVKYGMGGLIGSQHVPVNGSYVRKLFLPHWATFEGPGTYDITVSRTLSIAGSDLSTAQRNKNFPSKAITATSHTKVTIIENDKAKLGEVIDDLGNKMLLEPNNYDARDDLLLLDFIKDNRTIKYWIQAVKTYATSSDWDTLQRYRQTPVILARYNTPESFAALEAAMKSKTDDVRLDVADALGVSAHAKAWPLLLSMQSDPYWFVRLRVVQALGKLNTDASKEKLMVMLVDDSGEVRKEAEQFLRARNEIPDKLPTLPIEKQVCPIRQTLAVKTMQSSSVVAAPEKSGGSNVFVEENCGAALDAFLKELSLHHETKDVFGEAWVLYQIGDIYNEARRYQEAQDYYAKALPLFRQMKNDGQRGVLFELEGVSENLKNYAQALDYMKQELSLVKNSQNVSVRSDEGRILDRIATAYFESGDDINGFEFLKKRLNFERQKKSDVGEFIALNSIGKAYEKKRKKTEALEYYLKALDFALRLSDTLANDFLENEIKELREAIARLQK